MPRTFLIGLIAFGVVAGFPAPSVLRGQAPAQAVAAPTVDSLVAKNIEAKGGLERIRAVHSYRQTGTVTMPELPAPMPIVTYGKRPNLVRQDIGFPGGAIVVAFDGVVAWKIDPAAGASSPVAVTGAQADAIDQQSDFDGPLVDYKRKGSTIEYAGSEMFAGKSVQHLKVTDRKGRVSQCYLDAGTGLEVRVVSAFGGGTLEQQLADYRVVGGIKFPFSMPSFTSGRLAAAITIQKVELDVAIDDAFFKMPVK